MPDITSAGTKTKSDAGWEFLAAANYRLGANGFNLRGPALLIDGSSIGASAQIHYTDDQGVDRVLKDIVSLPSHVYIEHLNKDLKIVTTGSPNFNVSVSTDPDS